jgi:hypothetical protein
LLDFDAQNPEERPSFESLQNRLEDFFTSSGEYAEANSMM